MKRLLAQIGITYFSVLAAAFYLSDRVVYVIGGIAAVLTIVFFIIKKTRKSVFIPLMALSALIACIIHIGYGSLAVQPVVEQYGKEPHTVKAVLTEEPYQSYAKHYYRLKTQEIDGEKVRIKLLLKTPTDIEAEPDDIVIFTSRLKTTDNQYYRAKGYYLVSDDYDTVVDVDSPDTHSFYYHAIQLRRLMRKTLDTLLPPDCAALCRAVLIGDKYALSLDTRDHFRYAGASYFIVVSGMHFAVVIMLLFRLMKRLNRWVRFALIMVFIVLYAAVTGFQSSVLRAGIMMTFTVFGMTIRRQPYPLNHLGLAGIIMPLMVSPYGAGDIGLILSFYATMGILLWANRILPKISVKTQTGYIPQFHIIDRLRRYKESKVDGVPMKDQSDEPFSVRILLMKLWNSVAALLAVSLAANIMVFPVSVCVFHEFSLVTLLSSVLLYAEIYLILIISLAVCILYPLGFLRYLAILIAYPLMWLCKLVLWLVDGLASLPFAFFRVSQAFVYAWLAVTVILGIIVILYRNHYRYLKYAALCSAIILLGGCLTHQFLQMNTCDLEVYACGNGICAGINKGGKLYLLQMDANTKDLYPIWDHLSGRYGYAEIALCCNESEIRHFQLYRDDEFAISTLLLYDKKQEYRNEENIVPFDKDSIFAVDDDISIRVSVVGNTAVPYVNAGDRHILIIPSGCEIDDIPTDMRSADVILLSHAVKGMEELRCNDLIISENSELAPLTANALKDSYQHVYYTDQGDVHYRLR
jgi:competence protein ComEC